ncbi:MAG: hypothetical protein Tsb0013_23140 [Phycisphaerales bacterium]
MTPKQLRTALVNLNGERDAVFYFENADECLVPRAMLIPDEEDHLVKLTDGRHEYMIDAERVAWVRLG